ncbi:Z band alternatively spliced PDZ-motif protein 52 isoform X15 [Musca autumnalis]|uniref:Z band alternatively spliced PDZ-motif protein 52 isoform X15 n=1 Tax=Musca autumnalis TaxID=221902 RepID=UPI003CE9139B
MAQPQMLQIKLSRFDAQPWGFRLQGGTDFAQPLLVQKVNGGSLAEKAGLMPGDAVLKINDVDVFNLRHKEAQDIVVRSGNNFVMTVQRGGSTWRPHVTPTGNVPQPNQGHLQTVTKTSLAHKQQESQHIGCGYNNAAKPFGNTVDGNVKSIVNKQYNTPVGIYSDESIAETLSAQAEVLAGGVLGVNFKKNEKEYQADKSEVLKFLREEESGTSTPAFGSNYSGQDQQQQQHQQTQYQPQQQQQTQYQPQQHQQQTQYQPPQQQYQPSATKHVTAPVTQPKPPSTGGLPVGQNICYNCERLITGVFVRIKDKNLHVECFKCATCGTSLKNQGYYNFNNKLYCDIHAKLAAMQNPPPGTDGYVPVPIKPNTKLSASTITSALSAHGFNGVSNGSSTPTPAPVAPQQQLPTTTTTSTPPPSSNLPIVDKSLINSDNTKTNSNLNICNSNNTTTSSSNTATNDMSSRPSISEQSASNGVGGSGDKPFEYVTITGNVIRSVVPPGKGTNVNYKVNNQGYARPYGAPPAAAPKSPVTFPPQTQQWNAPPPTQPKPTVPAGNPYATLPRSNVGQGQESLTKPHMFSDTLPRKSNANPKINAFSANAVPAAVNSASFKQYTDLPPGGTTASAPSNEDPTAMLNASLSKMNMDNHMNNFMAEAGKVISNMLEARLANGGGGVGGGPSPQSGSSLSLRSNSSSNLSRSPMVVRKRLDLDDFKDINPIEPAALKPVIAVQQNVELKNPHIPQDSQGFIGKGVYSQELNAHHPMGKVLDICDNKFKPTSPLALRANTENSNAQSGGNLPPSETVIYRNNERSNRRASHAMDRRSYIESNGQTENTNKDGPVFSINVKALGKEGTDPNKPMSPENEQVVSQLLKEGKKPICCQCNNEITSGPFITALGKIWCPEHFHCVNGNCRRPLQDIGFVEEKGDLYCEYCFEKYLAPTCSKCAGKIKGDCLNAIGKHFHPECFSCGHCGKLFGNTPFFLEDGMPYCEADWNELFTTKCFACGFPVEAGDRWVEALNHNYHSQCFNCTYCKQNLEGQSFYNKGGRPFCKNHAR